MSEYLSKEEIKRWRSSLEKITLEEYAARLGKKIEETKPTRDLVDIVLQGKPVVSSTQEWAQARAERLSTIAERTMEREKEITITPFSVKQDIANSAKAKAATKLKVDKTLIKEEVSKSQTADVLREEVRIVFKKALTEREQRVFDYLVQNNNKIVYAKDLAQLLDLPRDYVYKYIKNLRTKIDGNNLQNADKGGFVLSF
jgi:DNA-binding CsgD family transcriptional regulator